VPTTEREITVTILVQEWSGNKVIATREHSLPCATRKIAEKLKNDIVDLWYRNRRGR